MVAHYLHDPQSGSYTRAKRRQEDEFLDQHGRFRTLMEIELRGRPIPPKKPTNQDNPILLNDTLVKANEEFEDVVEHLDDLISLGEI